MKTKLILIAVITVVGIGLLTAFKQSEGKRKYLMLLMDLKEITVIDENQEITKRKISNNNGTERSKDISKEINDISGRGYKLVNITGSTFIFEKE